MSAADALADLDPDDAKEVRTLLAKSQTVADRLPAHSAELKRQAAYQLGVSESAVDDLLASDDAPPSDPRLV